MLVARAKHYPSFTIDETRDSIRVMMSLRCRENGKNLLDCIHWVEIYEEGHANLPLKLSLIHTRKASISRRSGLTLVIMPCWIAGYIRRRFGSIKKVY